MICVFIFVTVKCIETFTVVMRKFFVSYRLIVFFLADNVSKWFWMTMTTELAIKWPECWAMKKVEIVFYMQDKVIVRDILSVLQCAWVQTWSWSCHPAKKFTTRPWSCCIPAARSSMATWRLHTFMETLTSPSYRYIRNVFSFCDNAWK